MTITETDSTKDSQVAFQITNIRPDRLGELFADGLIDDAQLRAGRKWQACSIGWWHFFHSNAERSLELFSDLKRMDKLIGPIGAALFRAVLDMGQSLEMATSTGSRKGKKPPSREQKLWRQRVFFRGLTKLAATTAH